VNFAPSRARKKRCKADAAVVVADPSVDSALPPPPPPNCLEFLRMRIKMKIKREVLRV